MKKRVLILLILIFTIFLSGCRYIYDFSNEIIVDGEGKVFVLDEDLDFSKDIISISPIEKDNSESIKELFSETEVIVSGQAISSEVIVEPDGFTYTIVNFKINEVYYGGDNSSGDDLLVYFIGGYMSGKKFIEYHPESELVKSGSSIEILEKELEDKIVRVNEVYGEFLPIVGEEYLLFLSEYSIRLDDVVYEDISGDGYAQGLFKITDGKIREYNPALREEVYKDSKEKGASYKETMKALEGVGKLISIEELVSRDK